MNVAPMLCDALLFAAWAVAVYLTLMVLNLVKSAAPRRAFPTISPTVPAAEPGGYRLALQLAAHGLAPAAIAAHCSLSAAEARMIVDLTHNVAAARALPEEQDGGQARRATA